MPDATRPARILFGVCLIAAPVLQAASTLFWSGMSAGLIGGVLMLYAFAFWIGVFVAFAVRLYPRMPRFALLAASLGVVGAVAGTNFGVEGIVEGILGIPDLTARLLEGAQAADATAVTLAFFAPGLLFPLMLLVFGVALARAKEIPLWCGTLLCLGGVAFPLSRIPHIQWVASGADLVILVPLLWLASQSFRAGDAAAQDLPQ
jgi:hypothetical protein